MLTLSEKECLPCKEGFVPLKGPDLQELFVQLQKGWKVIDEHYLEKEFLFKNFREALIFTNKIGELAESVGHHPDIYLAWGKVKITLWTHKINGLSEADFIFAAKVELFS